MAALTAQPDPPAAEVLPEGILRGRVVRRDDNFMSNDDPFPFVSRRADVILHLQADAPTPAYLAPPRIVLSGEIVSADWAAGEVVVIASLADRPAPRPDGHFPATHPCADPQSKWEMLFRHNGKVWILIEMGKLNPPDADPQQYDSVMEQPGRAPFEPPTEEPPAELPPADLASAREIIARGDYALAVDTLTYCLAELSTALSPEILYKMDVTFNQIASATVSGAEPPPQAVTTELSKLFKDRVEMAELYLLRASTLLSLGRPELALADCALARACAYHPRFVMVTESIALKKELLRAIPRVGLVDGKAKETVGEFEEAYVAYGRAAAADRVDEDIREQALAGQRNVENLRATYKGLIVEIELEDIEGLRIWRKLAVPACLSLGTFSAVIIGAMGWCNHPNHHFVVDGCIYLPPEAEVLQDVNAEAIYEDEEDFTLDELVGRKGAHLQFLYDFDDMWVHNVTVTDVIMLERDTRSSEAVIASPQIPSGPVMAGLQGPRVLSGGGACPPETVGGPQGYREFLDFLSGQKVTHSMFETVGEALDWAAGRVSPVSAALPTQLHYEGGIPTESWNIEGFNLAAVNRALENLQNAMIRLSSSAGV